MRFVLVAGEASGDAIGAGLIAELAARYPGAEFFGVGGEAMQASGLQAWFSAEELAVMGLFEVLRHLPRLLKRRREVIRESLNLQPDVYIGIDAPDFNLAIEKVLKRAGILTVHYVSPSIWAWRSARAQKIGQSADLVLCLFPFEPALYAKYGVDAEFVGHPLADAFPMEATPMFARTTLGLPLNIPIVAILPGSRVNEVQMLAQPFLDAAAELKSRFPKLVVIAPMANGSTWKTLAGALKSHHSVLMLEGQAKLALQAADAVIVASGTAALETALARKPMVVCYRLNALSYFLARKIGLLKSEFFSLPNKLAERGLVPELEQHHVTPENIVKAIAPVLERKFVARQESAEDGELALSYHDMHLALKQDANQRAADAVAMALKRRESGSDGWSFGSLERRPGSANVSGGGDGGTGDIGRHSSEQNDSGPASDGGGCD